MERNVHFEWHPVGDVTDSVAAKHDLLQALVLAKRTEERGHACSTDVVGVEPDLFEHGVDFNGFGEGNDRVNVHRLKE